MEQTKLSDSDSELAFREGQIKALRILEHHYETKLNNGVEYMRIDALVETLKSTRLNLMEVLNRDSPRGPTK